jgi:hypothetical protein
VVIDGVAASIASIIAAASPRVTMKAGTTVMLHNPWSAMAGNAKALRAEAGVLDTLREAMLDIYARKTDGKWKREDWSAALDGVDGADGSWLTGTQALACGLADEYQAGPLPKAKALAMIETIQRAAALHDLPAPSNILPRESPEETQNPTAPEPGPAVVASTCQPSVRVSNRPGAWRIPR